MSDKKCSLKVVSSSDGRLLHGTAAINHMISREGGFDKWMKKTAEDIALQTISKMIEEQRKPILHAVK